MSLCAHPSALVHACADAWRRLCRACCPVCAPVISDCGSGGQILADAATIQAVRSQLHLLGVVTASGLDYRLDAGRRRAAAASCLQPCR